MGKPLQRNWCKAAWHLGDLLVPLQGNLYGSEDKLLWGILSVCRNMLHLLPENTFQFHDLIWRNPVLVDQRDQQPRNKTKRQQKQEPINSRDEKKSCQPQEVQSCNGLNKDEGKKKKKKKLQNPGFAGNVTSQCHLILISVSHSCTVVQSNSNEILTSLYKHRCLELPEVYQGHLSVLRGRYNRYMGGFHPLEEMFRC